MNSRFDLNQQELHILISSMQCMTKTEEAHAGQRDLVSRLYNRLHTRHEYLLRIQKDYEHDI